MATRSPYRTTEEVAERYRTTPNTVRFWVATGRLKGIRVGKRRLFTDEELTQFEDRARAAS